MGVKGLVKIMRFVGNNLILHKGQNKLCINNYAVFKSSQTFGVNGTAYNGKNECAYLMF